MQLSRACLNRLFSPVTCLHKFISLFFFLFYENRNCWLLTCQMKEMDRWNWRKYICKMSYTFMETALQQQICFSWIFFCLINFNLCNNDKTPLRTIVRMLHALMHIWPNVTNLYFRLLNKYSYLTIIFITK